MKTGSSNNTEHSVRNVELRTDQKSPQADYSVLIKSEYEQTALFHAQAAQLRQDTIVQKKSMWPVVLASLAMAVLLLCSLILPRFSLADSKSETEDAAAITSQEDALSASSDVTVTGADQEQEASNSSSGVLPISAIAFDGSAQKQEVIYAKLSSVGSVQSLYAVNTLQGADGKQIANETIKDYGVYSEVINLTDNAVLKRASDGLVFTPTTDTFSYQGTMTSTALPWNISFEYCLDGVAVSPDELAGKSGHLELIMKTTKNIAVDETYFENYVLQASCSLAMDKAVNVKTDDGSLALSGSNTQVTFMVLPGRESECSLSADVTNFEMESISVAAVPLSMNIGSIDSSGLISNFNQLISGTKELEQGSTELSSGIAQFASGTESLNSGISQLNEQAQSLSSGVKSYTEGVGAVSGQLTDVIAKIKEEDPGRYVSVDDLKKVYSALSSMTEAEKTALENAFGLQAGSLDSLQESLSAIVKYMEDLDDIEGLLDRAESGLNQLTQSGESLSSGMERYAQGMENLSNSSGSLVAGVQQLSSGSSALSSGVGELSRQSQTIPQRVQSEIDAMLAEFDKSDYQPQSFTSSKNTDVTLVQFVMTTEAISMPEPEKKTQEETELSFIDRFFALFS